MTTIHASNLIEAPVEVCFRLSLSIDVELEAGRLYRLQAVGGVTSGVITAGQRVSWKARQFGVWVTHTTEITGFEEPFYFRDSTVQGLFRSFDHEHFFRTVGRGKTEMRDQLCFSMPLYLLGSLSEWLLIQRRLGQLLLERNLLIKRLAEAEALSS